MPQAALYLRSSKDRSDVSIDAQRRELRALAAARGFTIAHEFSDVVESGKSENRPGYQSLLAALKDPSRGWDHLLMTDTSRLSRRAYMAYVFEHEAAKRRVTVLYSKIPPVDPMSDLVIKGVLRVFDELHSHMSRAKGLAGMVENVRQGYRAGGRAPRGYRLEHIATGAMRDGTPVMKSKLVATAEARIIGDYLRARAMGRTRRGACRQSGLREAGLVDLEWNALTYAGCTVWNVRTPYVDGEREGYKRRPRSEWVIQEGTHQALITREEAEFVLTRLEAASGANYRARERCRESVHLLTGLLRTPDGVLWWSHGAKYYRAPKGRPGRKCIQAAPADAAIVERIQEDLVAPAFVQALFEGVRATVEASRDDEEAELQTQLRRIDARTAVFASLAGETTEPAPILRQMELLEQERRRIGAELARAALATKAIEAAAQMPQEAVREAIERIAAELSSLQGTELRETVERLVEKVVLDPQTLECRIHYRMGQDGLNVASPRGVEPLLPP